MRLVLALLLAEIPINQNPLSVGSRRLAAWLLAHHLVGLPVPVERVAHWEHVAGGEHDLGLVALLLLRVHDVVLVSSVESLLFYRVVAVLRPLDEILLHLLCDILLLNIQQLVPEPSYFIGNSLFNQLCLLEQLFAACNLHTFYKIVAI